MITLLAGATLLLAFALICWGIVVVIYACSPQAEIDKRLKDVCRE